VFILLRLLINATIGAVQEYGAQRAAASLKEMIEGEARVLREGRERSVPMRKVVRGDVVLVSAGDRVPADMRLDEGEGHVLNAVGDETDRPPRRPDEPILDRAMLAHIVVAGLWMGIAAWAIFRWAYDGTNAEEARVVTLMLMVNRGRPSARVRMNRSSRCRVRTGTRVASKESTIPPL
jgi:magnesium-transporting ATPase (P-type)